MHVILNMESDEQVNDEVKYVEEEETISNRTSNIPEEHICKVNNTAFIYSSVTKIFGLSNNIHKSL